MSDEQTPTRVWTVPVDLVRQGVVEIVEGDLDIPPGVGFDGIRERVLELAARQAHQDGPAVTWHSTGANVEESGVSWT